VTWTVAVVVVLFGAGFVFARFMRVAGMPVPIALVIFGVVVGAELPRSMHFALGPGLLVFFLPALIFEASWDSDARALRRTFVSVFVLAVPGVFVTAGVVAAAAALTHVLPWPAALVLGAIVAPTDPVTVLATFRHLRLPQDLVTIVEGEAIVNDGVAMVLAQGLAAFAVTGVLAGGPLGEAALMAGQSAGGIVIGGLLAFPAALALRAPIGTAGRVIATAIVAYGAYVLAMLFGASGIFAAAAAGVTMRALVHVEPASPEAQAIDRAWDAIAFSANAIAFLLVGLTLRLDRVFGQPGLFVAVGAALIGSRALLAYLLVPVGSLTDKPLAWRHTIALAGLRGGLSLALALGLPRDMPSRDAVVAGVFAVVFATLIVQGLVVAPILQRVASGILAPGPPAGK
jgi:CPA1 family monovalent cation:H+ antiporter